MTTKWTKGPWKVEPAKSYDVPDNETNYLKVYSVDPGPENPFTIVLVRDVDKERREANAQLIASAPVLYEALEAAKQVFGNDQHSGANFFNGENAAIARIDAALRAARGGQ